jgi:hypothetical protein
MTISEQLRFSILSAPVAAADRRALSQAWYSALYRTNVKPSAAPRAPRLKASRPGAQESAPNPRAAARVFSGGVRTAAVKETARPAIACERRSPRTQLARKMEHLVRQRQAKRIAATFVLDGTRARVRVLVSAEGGRVRVIAICSKRIEPAVAAALAQARYTAASKGVALNAMARSEVRC